MKANNNTDMAGWLIIPVILATAFVTSWAMLKYRPSEDPNAAYYPPLEVAQHLSPGIAGMQDGWQLTAAAAGVPQAAAFGAGAGLPETAAFGAATIPVIRAGAVPPHADRGICTSCHTVVGSRQNPIPPIRASSVMPHEYRGVCLNCHRLASPSGLNSPTPYRVQATVPVAAAAPMAAPYMAPPAATAPTEGEWMGLEVTPITSLTARQYGIPDGTQGLVVAEAEAQAATAGVKAGDVVASINGTPITQMTNFFQATRNGTMTQGVVEIVRKGQRLAVRLAPTPNPAAAPTPANLPPAGMRAAAPMPQGNSPIAPVNANAWGGGQGIGVAGATSPAAGCLRQF